MFIRNCGSNHNVHSAKKASVHEWSYTLTTNVFPDTPCVFVNHENNMLNVF